jgi:indolepyruvate ferredoxin oxidoreductase, beta subunit
MREKEKQGYHAESGVAELNILLSGVGGQGILKASQVMADVFMEIGADVKMSEIHGLSQRGGSVVTHLRVGKKVFSPTIIEGDCDILIGFEKLETVRIAQMMKTDGAILMNDQEILPISCVTGGKEYPEDIEETLRKYGKLKIVPALAIALGLGDVRTVNMAMVGAFSRQMFNGEKCDMDEKIFETVISRSFKGNAIEVNLKAFREGRKAVEE